MSLPPESYADNWIGQELWFYTMAGEWDRVVEIYKSYPWTHTAMINDYNDTALHVAADSGEQATVKQLVDAIVMNPNEREQVDQNPEINEEQEEEIRPKALTMKNLKGDTALHLAASRGFAESCKWIAEANRTLLDIRNKNGETPLFLAALNWHRDAFLLLCFRFFDEGRNIQLHHLRRNDGDSIMHCALQREYFGKANKFVSMYMLRIEGAFYGNKFKIEL